MKNVKIVKRVKKVNAKDTQKNNIMALIIEMLGANGIEASEGELHGMTKSTIVAKTDDCSVQIKLITPKAGLDFYPEVEYED